jgi:hypothetical protein
MPRVNPYRPEHDYSSEAPATSGIMLFVGLVAIIVLAAVMWASVSPPDVQPGAAGNPGISAPATPRTPSPGPAE